MLRYVLINNLNQLDTLLCKSSEYPISKELFVYTVHWKQWLIIHTAKNIKSSIHSLSVQPTLCFKGTVAPRRWTLRVILQRTDYQGATQTLSHSHTHLSLNITPVGCCPVYRCLSLIKEHFCASLISHNEFTHGTESSFFFPQSLTATKQGSRSSVWPSFPSLGLILWSVLRLRPDTQSSWVFVSHCGLGSCVWMCKRSSNGFRISSLKPLSDSTEGRTKTTHTYTFSFSYHSHLLFPIASNTENIWYNYHLAN